LFFLLAKFLLKEEEEEGLSQLLLFLAWELA
jgi:hypothetical protein